jgi:hypothetical protein
MQVVGVLAALATGGLLFAYPLSSETARPWLLYFAVCAMGVTVAILALMSASVMEVILKFLRRAEEAQRKREQQDGP